MSALTRTNREKDICEARTREITSVSLNLWKLTRQGKRQQKIKQGLMVFKNQSKRKNQSLKVVGKSTELKHHNFQVFQGTINIINAIKAKAIQIGKAVEQGVRLNIPVIEIEHTQLHRGKLFITMIGEAGFKEKGNDNLLDYEWLEKKSLNQILQTLMKVKIPKIKKSVTYEGVTYVQPD